VKKHALILLVVKGAFLSKKTKSEE